MSDTILAIDGGGTRSRGRLYAADGRRSVTVEGGPLNPSTDRDQAVRSVGDLLARLANGYEPGTIRLSLAAAGLRQPERRAAFLAGLPPFAGVSTITDGYAALVGASGGRPAGLVILGTGAVAHRLFADGTSVQRDGWGWLGGDRGSGAWIGRKAARHLFATRDGVATPGPLARRLDAVLGAADADALGWILSATQGRLAGLAPEVFAADNEGDGEAARILDRAADHLAALARSLDLEPDTPLFLAGGLLGPLGPRLLPRLDRAPSPAAGDAVDGAFLVATGAAPPEAIR